MRFLANEGDVRLVNGATTATGYLEVYLNKEWTIVTTSAVEEYVHWRRPQYRIYSTTTVSPAYNREHAVARFVSNMKRSSFTAKLFI